LVSWLHADVVMLFSGLVVAALIAVLITTREREPRRAWWTVLAVTLSQGVIGYVQYFTGLPEVLVALHMLGASLLVASLAWGVLSLRRLPV
ncbi:MAG: cytochrome oxidase assembly protein, partial [Humibacillus sp.]|nr:cytochrome oxidase assembly protein [Humibacillus sp.]